MAYPNPRPQQADPWATSSSYSSAWPAPAPQAQPQYGGNQSTSSGWQSGTNTSVQYSAPTAAPQYPASTSAPQWPSSTSAPQWPSANAWNQPPPASNAWQATTSPTNSAGASWPVSSPTNNNTSAAPWGQQQPSTNGWPAAPQQSQWDAWGAPSQPQPSAYQSQLNQSAQWTTQSQQATRGFNNADPFGTSMMNASATNTSYQSAASFNPFDVTNDDAGFFAAAPKPSRPAPTAASSAPAKDVPPPSATTQRLLRVASMLFERGAIIKADKLVIQEMILRGDKRAERALETAERDGRVDEVHAAILAERKREGKKGGADSDSDSGEDERAEAAAQSFKKRPSVARKNSDDDDDQTETLTDFRRQSTAPGTKGGVEAPHPAAGGYTGTVPPEMMVQKGQFVGTILMRISSKKMFRKWKPVFFALDLPRLAIFGSRREWEMGAAPKYVLPLHECMWIAKPTLKKTYSLIDDGRRVYYSTLKENSPAMIAQATMAGMERPTAFSPALESKVVAKFGSYFPDEISAFAHAIYSVVLHHQREIKASRTGGGGGGSRQDSFRGAGRTGSGY